MHDEDFRTLLHYFQAHSPHFKKDFKNFIYIKSKPLKKTRKQNIFNRISPIIHIQLLQTVLRIFLWGISGEKLFKDQSIYPVMVINKPFPSSPRPLYQNKVTCKCSAFDMEMIFHSHANKTHYHKKGCALGLILKVRGLELESGLFS